MQMKAAWYISVRCDYNLFFSDTYISPQHGYEYFGKSQGGKIHHAFCPDDLEKNIGIVGLMVNHLVRPLEQLLQLTLGQIL